MKRFHRRSRQLSLQIKEQTTPDRAPDEIHATEVDIRVEPTIPN